MHGETFKDELKRMNEGVSYFDLPAVNQASGECILSLIMQTVQKPRTESIFIIDYTPTRALLQLYIHTNNHGLVQRYTLYFLSVEALHGRTSGMTWNE